MNLLSATLLPVAALYLLTACGANSDTSSGKSENNSSSVGSDSVSSSSSQTSSANPQELPETPFSDSSDYLRTDFDLSLEADYWEIRRAPIDDSEDEGETLFSFDAGTREELSSTAEAELAEADSNTGFAEGCAPMHCPIFAVAVVDDTAYLQASEGELLGLLGELNTEAELYIWLYANEYSGEAYEEVDGGYSVIATWNGSCDIGREDLLFVDYNGVITKQETLENPEFSVCS